MDPCTITNPDSSYRNGCTIVFFVGSGLFLLLSSKNMIIFVKYRRVMLAENRLKPNYSNYPLWMHSTSFFISDIFLKVFSWVILLCLLHLHLGILSGYAFFNPLVVFMPLFNQNFKCFFFSIFFSFWYRK